jgi:hypothetical protein
MSTEEQRSEFLRALRELAHKGAESVGPVMTVALLEFAAADLQNQARDDDAWDEERYLAYCRANELALEHLAIARHRQGKPL